MDLISISNEIRIMQRHAVDGRFAGLV